MSDNRSENQPVRSCPSARLRDFADPSRKCRRIQRLAVDKPQPAPGSGGL